MTMDEEQPKPLSDEEALERLRREGRLRTVAQFEFRETYMLYTDEAGRVERIDYPPGLRMQRAGGW